MNNIRKTIVVTVAMFAFMFNANAEESGVYKIDPAHSKVGFEIAHLVISTVEGKFTDFSGSIDLNDKDFKKSKVSAVVNVKSIDTGVEKRDNHLRSKDFFLVSKYPEMKFSSSKIIGKKSNFIMIGDLTIKGVTKSVRFKGKYLGTVKDGYGNLKAAFSAETKIKRKEFGLNWNDLVEAGPVVGDEVTISLKIQGAKPLTSKQASQ